MSQRTVHFECRGCGEHVKRRVRRGFWLSCPRCGTVNPGPQALGVLNVKAGSPPRRVAKRETVKTPASREVIEL